MAARHSTMFNCDYFRYDKTCWWPDDVRGKVRGTSQWELGNCVWRWLEQTEHRCCLYITRVLTVSCKNFLFEDLWSTLKMLNALLSIQSEVLKVTHGFWSNGKVLHSSSYVFWLTLRYYPITTCYTILRFIRLIKMPWLCNVIHLECQVLNIGLNILIFPKKKNIQE